jgi:enediyne biosynthesis protein E4
LHYASRSRRELRAFPATTSRALFHNNGDGTFRDVSKESGKPNFLARLGAVATDINNDGWLDLFGANDTVQNDVWHGDHD